MAQKLIAGRRAENKALCKRHSVVQMHLVRLCRYSAQRSQCRKVRDGCSERLRSGAWWIVVPLVRLLGLEHEEGA
jgi:hypothetical protein